MGRWNNFMKEREQAPLDQLAGLIKQKWEETKEWLHDNCVDEGEDSSNKRARKAEKTEQQTSVIHQQGNVCFNYEELDQRSSAPPSAPPSQQNVPPAPMASTLPLPGVAPQMPMRQMPPLPSFGYEELDQRSSASPRAPPSQQNAPPAPMSSTLPLPGVAPQMPMRQMPPLPTRQPQMPPLMPPSAGMSPLRLPAEALKEIRQMWQRGDHIEVWSASKKCWFEGIVIESCAVDSVVDGHNFPAGTYKVQYSENTMKWIWPNQVHEVLRKPSGTSGI